MAKSGNATAQGDEIKGDLGRVRRRSKDIEHDLNSLAEAAAEWNMLAGGGRNRRNSKDYTDESLLEAFHEIDTDKSGSIEEAELEAAIRAMDPSASAAKIRDMLDFADADGDGLCVPAPLLPLPISGGPVCTVSRTPLPPRPLSHPYTRALLVPRVTFEEFKKIMMYNPGKAKAAAEGAPAEGEAAAAEAAPEAPAAA